LFTVRLFTSLLIKGKGKLSTSVKLIYIIRAIKLNLNNKYLKFKNPKMAPFQSIRLFTIRLFLYEGGVNFVCFFYVWLVTRLGI